MRTYRCGIVSQALGDYIHSKGLLFGMYTAIGSNSCCNFPALNCPSVDKCEQAHQDVQTYVDWGIDYIKVDSCKNYNASSFNTTIPLISGWCVLPWLPLDRYVLPWLLLDCHGYHWIDTLDATTPVSTLQPPPHLWLGCLKQAPWRIRVWAASSLSPSKPIVNRV